MPPLSVKRLPFTILVDDVGCCGQSPPCARQTQIVTPCDHTLRSNPNINKLYNCAYGILDENWRIYTNRTLDDTTQNVVRFMHVCLNVGLHSVRNTIQQKPTMAVGKNID